MLLHCKNKFKFLKMQAYWHIIIDYIDNDYRNKRLLFFLVFLLFA